MEIPWHGQVAHRAVHTRTPYAFANALLLTGKREYVDVWRNVIDTVNANARQEDERTCIRACTVDWIASSGCSEASR